MSLKEKKKGEDKKRKGKDISAKGFLDKPSVSEEEEAILQVAKICVATVNLKSNFLGRIFSPPLFIFVCVLEKTPQPQTVCE